MKKLTIILIFICNAGYSQFASGIKAGALLANLKFENTEFEKAGIKPSFYVGAFMEYKFNRIVPEIDLSYNLAGDKGKIKLRQNVDDNPESHNTNYKLNSLLLSATAKFFITKKFALKLGGYYGKILSAKVTIEDFNGQSEDTTELKTWSKNDSGVLFGINYYISKNLFLDGTYQLGILSLNGFEGQGVYSRNIKIGAGYKF